MEPREIIPRTRSMVAAGGAFITSAGVVALATGIVFDAGLPWLGQVATFGVGALFAVAMLTIALRLLAARGGLVVDTEGARVGIGVTSERDTWWVPVNEIIGIRVVAEATTGETIERWLAVMELAGRSSVVLARTEDRGVATLVARRLADGVGIEDLDGERAAGPEADQRGLVAADAASAGQAVPAAAASVRLAFGVHRRGALQGMLFFFGVSLTIVGAGMFARVEHDPVFGFLFGPLLGLLGLALLGVTVVKRFGFEELRRDGDRFVHGYRLGRFTWGHRQIQARAPRWHLYVHGLRGAHLELVGSDGTLVIGGGATTRSVIDLEALARVPERFTVAG
ncbi:MAG: hypothetical protein CVU56_19470 [Deltaproteobacteria bacterium HGW-Deltaproteobacteria-14]|jgi:hypothetical protein|nr:MAG: hypothetical protein CVU56_19470 [Deltaproteobacteria bacterium HGW-Deltaproteobacteria-14]